VPRENGALPFPSRVNPLDWYTDPHRHTGVGEVYGEDRTFASAKPVRVLGDHVCGTEDDFRLGQLREDGRPPTEYWPSGIPKCCDTDRREAEGGMGLGGAASARTDPSVMASGGVGLGGAASARTDSSMMASGGVGLGGAAEFSTETGTALLPYQNGTFDGQTNAYAIAESAGQYEGCSFPVGDETSSQVTVWFWVLPGETPLSLTWTLSTAFADPDLASGTVTTGWVFLFTNDLGYDVWQVTFPMVFAFTAGTYWLLLHESTTDAAGFLFWDQATGGASAVDYVGSPPDASESFLIE
jgi:hypothetical protein